MQILRRLMLVGVATTFFTPILLHAYDNEEQIRARQALEEKMNQLDAQPVTTNAAPPPAAPAKPKPAATKPVVKPQPPAQASTPPPQKKAPPATPVTTSQPQKQAPPTQPVAQPAPIVKSAPPTPAPAAKPAAPAAPTYSSLPAAPSADTQTSTKLDTALNTKMMQTEPAPAGSNLSAETSQPWSVPFTPNNQNPGAPAQPAPTHKHSHTQAETPPIIEPSPAIPTMPAPPTGLSSTKQEKLDHLLQLYRADQITPQEYHDQRAKILAEP